MRPSGIVLRLLLCLALVVNGLVPAMASPRVAANRVGHDMAMRGASAAAAPCHETGMAMEPATAPKHAHALVAPHKHITPDCCQSGLCACACTPLAQAVFAVVPSFARANSHAMRQAPLATPRASPLLLHLIRPPIA